MRHACATRSLRIFLTLSLPCIALLSSLAASAAVVERELPLAAAWRADDATGRWLNETAANPGEDRALLPSVTWWWVLEPGEKIAGAELFDTSEAQLASSERSAVRLPLVSDEGNASRLRGGEPLYSQDYAVDISQPQFLHGRALQSITVTPFRQDGVAVLALERATVRLRLEGGARLPELRPERADFPLRERMLRSLGREVLNAEALPAPTAPAAADDRAIGGGDWPTEVPNIEGAAVEMVIVTPDSFADLCQEFADFKTALGVPTVVRTIEWIKERYNFGSDRTELVRNFLRDAYSKWSISYALLVGDSKELPPRYAFSELFVEDRFNPTDLYFACLDGDWNSDHDELWAEPADTSSGDWGDEADLMAEIAVGRLPASNRTNCAVLLDKSRTYQEAQMQSYHYRFLMLAEVLFPTTYPGTPVIYIDGAWACESIFGNYTDGDQHVVRLYETCDSFPNTDVECLTTTSARDSMNNGAGIVLHNGHGARQTMSVGNGSLDSSVINHLTNGNKTFLLYMINCTAAAFDYNCLAEAFLDNAGGGANSVIGSTRETFPNINVNYMKMFFEQLHTDAAVRLGDLHYATMNAHAPLTLEDNGYRWGQTTLTLLADPSSWIHYQLVKDLTITAPSPMYLDGGPVTVNVADFGLPVESALVTMRKTAEDYQRGLTDAAGNVSFVLNPSSIGSYKVSANARDLKPKEVTRSAIYLVSAPLLSISAIVVDDVSDGTVVGNGNGIAERNETLRLKLTVRNTGLAAATGVAGQLTGLSPNVTVLDDADTYGDIPAAGSSQGTSFYLLQLGPDSVDDEIMTFTLQLASTQGISEDDFFLEGASPILALFRTDIDDSSAGDGDSILEIGENADILVRLSNYGRGTAQGIVATVVPAAGSGLFVGTGSAGLGDLAPLAIDQGPALFNVTRVSASPATLDLLLTDSFGHEDAFPLDLARGTELPTGVGFELLRDVTRLRVQWAPPATEAVGGYQVFRSDSEEGPFAAVSSHWVSTSSSFEDRNLLPFSQYWYKVQTISPSGLLGPITSPVSVTTNPSLVVGWPVILAQETPGTPVVGDFSGDGNYEIMVGADLVYGFFPSGAELSDGDGNPNTTGPISGLGNRFYCSLTATDLTPSPGIELVACSWNTGEVFLFEFTKTPIGEVVANVAPGWPRMIASPSPGIWSSPALGDIDGDGDKEILVIDIGGYLHAWHADGTEVRDGDNNPATDGVFKYNVGSWSRGTTAFADVDHDGAMELFVPSSNGRIYGYHGDGSTVAGFPFLAPANQNDGIYCSPSIGDVDGDGEIEIVFTSENDSLYCINHNGTRRPGWPIFMHVNNSSIMASSAALADITGDGIPEIFACGTEATDHMVLGWLDKDANWLPGWPVDSPNASQSSPVVGDLDGDGDLEVVLANENATVQAWHHDGTEVAGFPLITGDYNRSTPLLMDVNEDGNLDLLLVGWDKSIYLWTFPTVYDGHKTPWYTYCHDQMRTSNAGTLDWVVGVDLDEPVPGLVQLDANWPNPFNPTTTIRFTIGDGASVRLSVYDLRGRLVAALVDEDLPAGVYQRSWNGRDAVGTPQASGIYFARLQVGDKVESRKMTLLK